jgi:heme exporter protein CcmD
LGVGEAQPIAVPTPAERAVADLLDIQAAPPDARAVLESVPFWFHTFALNRREGIYTPGVARDHRYRIPVLPERFHGLSVLDVGTFDGFYAFLAESRGARRVSYEPFIIGSYAVALLGLGGLVVASLLARRRVRRELGERGLERRR